MNTPTPARIAAAIADLGAEAVRDAWHLTNAWARLGAVKPADPVGVPLLELRHALERPRVDTQAVAAVTHWRDRGARGLLGLAGQPGRGKSHAGVCWAIDRAREHKDTLWVACADWPESKARANERDALVRRASHASALVLDDIGAGNSKAPWVAEQLEGLLLARVSRSGTLLITNKSRAELAVWLGGRLWDRLAYAGGIVEIGGEESMRARDDVELDMFGRSPRWHAARELVDLVGCELVDGRLDVGRKLEADAAAYRLQVEAGADPKAGPCARACKLLGLDSAKVRRRAAELAEAEAEIIRRACRDYGVELDVDALVNDGIAAALVKIVDEKLAKRDAVGVTVAAQRVDEPKLDELRREHDRKVIDLKSRAAAQSDAPQGEAVPA